MRVSKERSRIRVGLLLRLALIAFAWLALPATGFA